MNKKQRILPIADKIEINQEAFTNENLPDSEAVNQTVAMVRIRCFLFILLHFLRNKLN